MQKACWVWVLNFSGFHVIAELALEMGGKEGNQLAKVVQVGFLK